MPIKKDGQKFGKLKSSKKKWIGGKAIKTRKILSGKNKGKRAIWY